MFEEYFKIAWRNLRTRSLRSWLTILGIVIGIFLVVSLVSLAQGVVKSIEGELQAIGGDVILVMPGKGFSISALMGGLKLEARDIEAIKKARGVETVIEFPWGVELVRHREQSEHVFLSAIEFDEGILFLEELMGWETVKGELPRAGRREVLVGNLVPQDVFPGLEPGDEIILSGRRYTVSGVLRSLGNKQDDMAIVMDLSDYRNVTGEREGSQMAMVRAQDGFEIENVVENIERELEESSKRRRSEAEGGFSVLTSDAATGIVNNIMLILQIAVFAFASIAVLVGAVGIMNSMFTSVWERTKEIGILKAVGAKRKNIVSIFLIEAGIIGLVGGIIGIILGAGAAKIGEFFLRDAHPVIFIEAHVSPSLVLFVLFFSSIVGCVSGFLPARKAAKMEPVDALHYE